MTVPLTPDQRQRLAKLLGMLGSSHCGERDAAGLAAHRLVQQHGLTWFDLLGPPQVAYRQPDSDEWPEYAEHANCAARRQIIEQCWKFPDALTQWETRFLRDIWRCRRLMPRQREILDGIAEKVLTKAGKKV